MEQPIIKSNNELLVSASSAHHVIQVSKQESDRLTLTQNWELQYPLAGRHAKSAYIKFSDLQEFTSKRSNNSSLDSLAIITLQEAAEKIAKKNKEEQYFQLLLEVAYSNYSSSVHHYYCNDLGIDKIYRYAKSHSLLRTMINLKKKHHGVIPILHKISKQDQFSDSFISTISLQYFYKLLVKAEKNGISETLVHGLYGKKSNHQKVTPVVQSIILYFHRHGHTPHIL